MRELRAPRAFGALVSSFLARRLLTFAIKTRARARARTSLARADARCWRELKKAAALHEQVDDEKSRARAHVFFLIKTIGRCARLVTRRRLRVFSPSTMSGAFDYALHAFSRRSPPLAAAASLHRRPTRGVA